MDKIKQLYNLYLEQGLITEATTFESFKAANVSQQQQLFDLGKEDGLFESSTVEDFSNAWADPLKKKDQKGAINMDSVSPDGSLVSQDSGAIYDPSGEKDYFQGTFGDVLRGLDMVVPLGMGDFADDMARSVASGYYQGVAAENASDLLISGSMATQEDIESFIESNKKTQTYGQSKEMQEYMKIYEENGKSFKGVVLGLLKSGLTIVPELFVSSMTAMASNSDSLTAAAATIGTGASTGALGGAAAGGIGALPGAIAGGASALPYAFAAAGSVLEMGSTFSELLTEAAEGEELDSEKITELLNDPEKFADIRNKAVARGLTIGAIDAFTGKLGGKIAGKVLSKSGKQAARAASQARTTGAVATAGVVEGFGGSIGEVAGRVAADQEMDISEIVLEGLAEMPGGVKDIISTRFSAPSYKVNGQKVTAEKIDELIETMTLDELVKSNIKIKNDYEGREGRRQDKIIQLSTKQDILNVNPNLDESTLNALTELQIELDKLEGNKTEPSKERASALREEMKSLQETPSEDKAPEKTSARDYNAERFDLLSEEDKELANRIKDETKRNKFVNNKTSKTNEGIRINETEAAEKALADPNSDEATLIAATRKMEDPMAPFNAAAISDVKKDLNVNQENKTEVVETEEVTYTLPEDPKEARKDFEIIDNRDGKESSIDEEGNGKWIVVNKKTGRLIETNTKKDAELLARYPKLNWDYGEGDIFEQDIADAKPGIEEKKSDVSEIEEIVEEVDVVAFTPSPDSPYIVPGNQNKPSNIQINFTDDGKIKSVINIKTGNPVSNASRKKAEKIYLESFVDVNQGEVVKFPEGTTPEQANDLIAEESKNIREISEAIKNEEQRLKEANEQAEKIKTEDEGLFSLTTLAFTPDSWERVTGLPPSENISSSRWIRTKEKGGIVLEDGVNGLNTEQIVEFVTNNPTAADVAASTGELTNKNDLISLQEKFESLTGLKATTENINTVLGVDPSRGPITSKTILGNISDPQKITNEQKRQASEVLEEIQRTSKTPESAYKKASKLLAKEVKELVRKGVVTTKQMADVMSKFANVTMFSPASRDDFLNYMTRVFANKEYAGQVSMARSKQRKAKKNAGKKIGKSDALIPQLKRLFTVNPSLIPESVFEKYISLVEMFSKGQAVLTLDSITEVTQQTEEILRQLDEERSMVIDLTQRFNETNLTVKNKEDKVDYSATIKKMLDANEINEDEYQVMKKYRSQINPKTPKTPKTDAEIEVDRKKLVKVIKSFKALKISELPSRDEQRLASKFEDLINSPAIETLSVQELENILRLMDNINNGYLPHLTQVNSEKLNSINLGKELSDAIQSAKPLKFSGMYSRIKALITRKGGLQELIRRNPLFYIDQVFGDFKTKTIFDSLFGQAAEAVASFRFEFKIVENAIEKASAKVYKSLGSDSNKFLMSTYKQMVYMIENEFRSNPGNPQANSVVGFLKATIAEIDEGTTRYGEQEANMLQEILNTYTNKNGEFNADGLYDSFNQAEKESIDAIYKINKDNAEKAAYTATIIRGVEFNPLNNYVHLNVLPDSKDSSVMGDASVIDAYNKALMPSTKAKSLIERTGSVSPLNFDVYASASRGSKYVLMDYHLTEPIRTGRKTLNQARKNLKESGPDKRLPSKQRDVLNAIQLAYDEAVENLLINSFGESSIADEVLNYLQKTGYRSILAGGGRFVAESVSNISFALLVDPKGFAAGAKLSGVIADQGASILNNLNSKQTTRLFGEGLNTRYIDTSIISQRTGATGGKAVSKTENFLLKVWDKSGQKWVKGVETIADYLISTPDKAVMRPMWFGAFENRFKKLTGKKPDFNKIAANDQAYMEANKEALAEAKDLADRRSVMAGATDNAFMGMLKGTSKPNQSLALKAFNTFNNFMTRFLIFEYITARTGVMSLIGKGELTKTQGAALIGGVTSRMVLYTLIGQMLAEGMTSLFDDDDDDFNLTPDEDGMKSPEKMLGQAFASSFTSLLFGRDFGNATKSIINLGVEEFNESQLEFLRDGDYDPYKDALQYTIVPKSESGKGTDLGTFLKRIGAAYGPILGTADLLLQALTEDKKKTQGAQERQDMENYVRLPLELLGNLGFVPLYKDVRKIVLDQIYGDLSRAKKQLKDKRKAKKEMLQGYDSESDMKRYDLGLWERTYGPESEGYDERNALKEIKKAQRKIKQEQKDALYNYTPRPKKKKKSTGFGRQSTGRKKKSTGFGRQD